MVLEGKLREVVVANVDAGVDDAEAGITAMLGVLDDDTGAKSVVLVP